VKAIIYLGENVSWNNEIRTMIIVFQGHLELSFVQTGVVP